MTSPLSRRESPAAGVQPVERLGVLDLLRFVAALSVVFYHLTYRPEFLGVNGLQVLSQLQSISRFGYLGVDLFFLISGFVILWSASGRTAADYVASRMARLLPSLWVAIAITSAVLIAFGRGQDVVNPPTISANMTLSAGYLGFSYIDEVYWTLQTELKFYALVLVLIATGQMQRVERWVLVWICGLALCWLPFAPGALKSLLIFPYGSYFAAGSLFFLIWREGASFRRVAGIGVALVLSLLCAAREAPAFMTNGSSAGAIGTSAAIVVAQFLLFFAVATRSIRLPESPLWFALGSLTYPLYLIHNQIGKTLAEAAVGSWGVAAAIAVGFTVPFLLSYLMARTVEARVAPSLRRALIHSARKLRRTA